MYNPSNPIESFRVSNLHIVDDAGIFSSNVGGLLGTQIDTTDFTVLSNNIKLFLYTSINERSNWMASNLSSNEVAVFIFKKGNKLLFRIKLSDNLVPLSRFKFKKDMLKCEIEKDEYVLKGKKLSIAFFLSFFDTLEKTLFNLITNEEVKNAIGKQIKISKVGSLDPIIPNPVNGKLNVTIGLFFDGTGNNKYNTESVHDVIAKMAEENKDNKCFSDFVDDYHNKKLPPETPGNFEDFMFKPKSSYLNSYSNISRLYDRYNETDEKEVDITKEIVIKIYIDGIGTKKWEEDSGFGGGLGRGDYGVHSRCLDAIAEISSRLLDLQKKYKKNEVEVEFGQVLFDIFGFSRGATTARLFYTALFNVIPINPTEKFMLDGKLNTYIFLRKIVKECDAKIRFMGLFDTVLTTLHLKITFPTVNDISLKDCDFPCYHITAQDEIRENFRLTNVDSQNFVRLELFGAHSDIGGSYTRDKFTSSFAFEESEKSEPNYKLKKIFNNYKLRYAVDTRKKYFRYFIDEVSLKYRQIRIQLSENPNVEPQRLEGFVAMDHRFIENDIAKVSLHAMLLFAAQHKLPFKEYDFDSDLYSKLPDEANKAVTAYKILVEKLIADIKNNSEKTNNLEEKDFFNLYNKFIHISESYEYQPDWLKNAKINEYFSLPYTDRPTDDRKRFEYFKRK